MKLKFVFSQILNKMKDYTPMDSEKIHPKPDPAFIKFLEDTTEALKKWPAWKRNHLGPFLPEDVARAKMGVPYPFGDEEYETWLKSQ